MIPVDTDCLALRMHSLVVGHKNNGHYCYGNDSSHSALCRKGGDKAQAEAEVLSTHTVYLFPHISITGNPTERMTVSLLLKHKEIYSIPASA